MGRVPEELLPGAADRVPAALVPGRAVQDPVVVDAADARGRRLHPGQQVHLRHPPADHRAEDHPDRRPAARRRRGVPLSASIRRRTTSSAWSASAATSSSTATSGSRSTASRGRRRPTARTATSRACASRRSSGCSETDGAGGAPQLHDRRQSAGAAGLSAERAAVSRAARIATTMSAASPARCPPGHYFMMGDNRDNSDDSRYWGFVPDDHIRGQAFFIWFNWDDIATLRVQARRQRHPMTRRRRGRSAAAAAARTVDDRLPVRRGRGRRASR